MTFPSKLNTEFKLNKKFKFYKLNMKTATFFDHPLPCLTG